MNAFGCVELNVEPQTLQKLKAFSGALISYVATPAGIEYFWQLFPLFAASSAR